MTKNTYDVFVSHSRSSADLAGEIAENLRLAGLQTFHDGVLHAGADFSDAIWQALAESRAVVVIVTPEAPADAVSLVEIGAAAAWNKPLYVLIDGPSSTKLPAVLDKYPVYPVSRLEEVVRKIVGSFEPLTQEEQQVLGDVYRECGVPADQLSLSPLALRELAEKFNQRAAKHLSGERVLSEILRMRKSGRLPRLAAP